MRVEQAQAQFHVVADSGQWLVHHVLALGPSLAQRLADGGARLVARGGQDGVELVTQPRELPLLPVGGLGGELLRDLHPRLAQQGHHALIGAEQQPGALGQAFL
jgi:hypothetical protein